MANTQRPERSFVERARRAQLIDVTIALVAEHGYAATSLAKIAQAAGITKGAVLYHFETKDAVVTAAHDSVLSALVKTVSDAVEGASVQDRPAAYVRAMIGHLRRHPEHTRMLTQSLTTVAKVESSRLRWAPLADLIDAARNAGSPDRPIDSRSLAISIGGAIDAVVMERLTDSAFATEDAAEMLVEMLQAVLQGE